MRLTYPSSVSLPSNESCSEPFISFEAQILLILSFFLLLFFWVIRYIKVAELSEGGPAEKAGVKAGDILVSIEGKSLFGITIDGLAKLFERFPCTYALTKPLSTTNLRVRSCISLWQLTHDVLLIIVAFFGR